MPFQEVGVVVVRIDFMKWKALRQFSLADASGLCAASILARSISEGTHFRGSDTVKFVAFSSILPRAGQVEHFLAFEHGILDASAQFAASEPGVPTKPQAGARFVGQDGVGHGFAAQQ